MAEDYYERLVAHNARQDSQTSPPTGDEVPLPEPYDRQNA